MGLTTPCEHLGHPISTEMTRQMAIAHENISHIIESYEWKGNVLHGKVTTAPTPRGRDMAVRKTLIKFSKDC